MTKINNMFASDNCSGVHPEIFKAMEQANRGYEISYGDDKYTGKAIKIFKEKFGGSVGVFFVLTGTAANVLSITAASNTYNSVICAETAHINVDECGAPEKFAGIKLQTIRTNSGKIVVSQIEKFLNQKGVEHHSQPKIISISEVTEYGTIYTPDEIKSLADFAHSNDMYLHMDGARLSNACAFLGCDLRELTGEAGVDILSFGGTKNGMMLGESVVIFNSDLNNNFKYIRKQGMQLFSKMRYISAQFVAFFNDDLWLKNAKHANEMAQVLAEKLSHLNIKITNKVEANAVFAIFPKHVLKKIREKYFFYVWNEEHNEVRLMTSFNTEVKDIEKFASDLRNCLG